MPPLARVCRRTLHGRQQERFFSRSVDLTRIGDSHSAAYLHERLEAPVSFRAGASDFPQKGDTAMDWDRVQGSWKQFTGKVKEKWGKLTDDDLTAINGRRDQLEGKIQERYGIAKDQVRRDVDTWLNQLPG
jgi:uncharacterized protein YjbJ (UPF0337 family)